MPIEESESAVGPVILDSWNHSLCPLALKQHLQCLDRYLLARGLEAGLLSTPIGDETGLVVIPHSSLKFFNLAVIEHQPCVFTISIGNHM